MNDKTLLIPDKPDLERDALALAWQEAGGRVKRVAKFWEKPKVSGQIALYGFDTFCLVLAQILNLELVQVKDEMIADLGKEWLKRMVKILPISAINTLQFPLFVKSVRPKLFPAKVYPHQAILLEKLDGFEETELLIISEVVKITAEIRAFVLHQKLMDLAYYEGRGNLENAKIFLIDFLENFEGELPQVFVLDLGYNPKTGWFILEFNNTWGAGLNGCSPKNILPCIAAATILS